MAEYDFLLKFDLHDPELNPDVFIDALYESGCDDAVIGVGHNGRISLHFTRNSQSALEAVSSAISNVKTAIPHAKLVEATPDLVGLTDIAEILGCSRQNVRKLAMGQKAAFPSPIHEGTSSLWHLANVLDWFQDRDEYHIEKSLHEVSGIMMQVNIARQTQLLDPVFQEKIVAML